tara:strand:+ start:4100 stop:4372 length:273 start_codon:yes stop_codon:yes gene_type:complete
MIIPIIFVAKSSDPMVQRSFITWIAWRSLMQVGDLIRYADPRGVHYGLVMKIVEPFIDDDRQIYCSWLDEDPWHWSWVEEEEAEVISEGR